MEVTKLKKQILVLKIALIILLLSNAIIAFVKLSSNTTDKTEKLTVLREQKASLATSVEIKKCIEGLKENNLSAYSQKAIDCIHAGDYLYNTGE